MATIKNRTAKDGSLRYTVEVRLKGYPPQTATFRRLTDARRWIQQTESAIREGRHFKTAEAKKHTLSDAIERYISEVLPGKPKSLVHYKIHLNWFNREIGAHSIADITPALLVTCKNKLLSEATPLRSPATVNRYLSSVSALLNIAVREWQWLEDSPMRHVKKSPESRGRVRFLDDDERQRLLAACKDSTNDRLYLCVILALSTGMRQGELMGLKWPDVSLNERNYVCGFVILHDTKNGERRRVPLSGLALELLQEHAKIRRLDTDLLFPSRTNKHKPIDLRRPWTDALKRARITDFHWHDLRHCTASYLAMNGASLAEIAEILGHKTLAMVKRYSHLSDAHVSNVIASMNAKIFGGG